mmetsp:Transcript_23987/g.30199  ORF Transcript_23987/g.30199 Transcript_23987/m.30199 type:complete len:199 (+) Transcript_23987:84-680(+)
MRVSSLVNQITISTYLLVALLPSLCSSSHKDNYDYSYERPWGEGFLSIGPRPGIRCTNTTGNGLEFRNEFQAFVIGQVFMDGHVDFGDGSEITFSKVAEDVNTSKLIVDVLHTYNRDGLFNVSYEAIYGSIINGTRYVQFSQPTQFFPQVRIAGDLCVIQPIGNNDDNGDDDSAASSIKQITNAFWWITAGALYFFWS